MLPGAWFEKNSLKFYVNFSWISTAPAVWKRISVENYCYVQNSKDQHNINYFHYLYIWLFICICCFAKLCMPVYVVGDERLLSCGCTSGAGATASGYDDTVPAFQTVLSHLHHLSLQQRDTPLHCVLWTNRNQAADVRRTSGGQTL